ncbi:MAG: cyclic nucleotide-binding domain-containing protein, partial [Polyangiales bacterium]
EGKLVGQTSRHTWSQHEVLNATESMARRRTREAVIAEVPTRTLRLSAKDFAEILEDNFGFLSNVRRALARRLLTVNVSPPPLPPTVDEVQALPEMLGMVDRLIVLRTLRPFGKGRIEALAALAMASEEIRIPANTQIGAAGDPASSVLIVLEGSVSCTRAGAPPQIVGVGHAIGALETLGEVPYTATIRTLSDVRALRCPGAALFDVLEDHTDLALGMIESLSSSVLDAGLVDVFVDRLHVN